MFWSRHALACVLEGAAVCGWSPGVVGAQHPALGWMGGSPGCTLRAPWRWDAGAGVPGPLGGMRGQCLVLIKTLLVILLWLAASPALPT